ncbi:MAG: DMT family transporter [Alphaproteobacteria bacterium]|nr:DMT family transporter [Alphaproteobacteria bacterium]
MREGVGIAAAVTSTATAGMAGAVTRYIVGAIDPVALAAARFGLGFLCLLPLALLLHCRWPRGRDWAAAAGLGAMMYVGFYVTYNSALAYTTAGRGTLCLSVMPLLTMVVAALHGAERLSWRKTTGVLIATAGVAVALVGGLPAAPAGAWRGDLLMVAAALCMTLYNVWSRPFIGRSDPLGFVTASMGLGAAGLVAIAAARGGFAAMGAFDGPQWTAILYLAVVGGAVSSWCWVFALRRTTPTRAAAAITVNPIAASLLAAWLLDEPIGLDLVIGVAAVAAGIYIASTDARRRAVA